MCQPWNLELHPEAFPRTIHVLVEDGRCQWGEPGDESASTVEGRWISDREFEAADGRVFLCPPPDADGLRHGEVLLKGA
jgi:hypothetical protein